MAYIFRNDEAMLFMKGEGFVGSYNDMLLAYLRAFYSVAGSSLPDLLSRYIKEHGKEFIPL
jgi:hypothetical protein